MAGFVDDSPDDNAHGLPHSAADREPVSPIHTDRGGHRWMDLRRAGNAVGGQPPRGLRSLPLRQPALPETEQAAQIDRRGLVRAFSRRQFPSLASCKADASSGSLLALSCRSPSI
jgi:hypothetical protein